MFLGKIRYVGELKASDSNAIDGSMCDLYNIA